MSASGYKRTCGGVSHYVRFTPDSGRNWVWHEMSAFDPKRILERILKLGGFHFFDVNCGRNFGSLRVCNVRERHDLHMVFIEYIEDVGVKIRIEPW